uniref:Uncharacterized protein n=1 Tax=uncultured Vibrionales bacterium HF0010_22E23 TaxID=710999 RepID=E0XRG8_9GAMM|nr:hypothetical protein [uncultured Vibrionales bacterium HF0010_22E23]
MPSSLYSPATEWLLRENTMQPVFARPHRQLPSPSRRRPTAFARTGNKQDLQATIALIRPAQ